MPEQMSQADYLSRLNNIAMYAATRGSPLFLPRHFTFLVAYLSKWRKLQPGPDSEKAALEVLFHSAPKWAEHPEFPLGTGADSQERSARSPLFLADY
jgi:hypothetical protein